MTERRAYNRHGLNVLKARAKIRGFTAIDRRTAAARDLLACKADLESDLGGADALSAQQRGLIDLAVRTRLYVDSLDAYIMEQPSLVNHRRRSLLPVVRERAALADSLARLLGQLGIERKAKPILSLAEYLKTQTRTDPASTEIAP